MVHNFFIQATLQREWFSDFLKDGVDIGIIRGLARLLAARVAALLEETGMSVGDRYTVLEALSVLRV